MARKIIDTGIEGNTATGDTIRTAMNKINTNFDELYTDLAGTTTSGGILINPVTNGDTKILANGTGIVEIDRLSINNTTISSLDTNADITLTANGTGSIAVSGPLKVGTGSAAGSITSNGAQDLKLDTNSGTDTGSIELKDGTNGDMILTTDGSGDILLKAGGRVGVGSVNQPDTLLHLKATNSVITLQRTADANTPGLNFQNSGGNVRGTLKMDGTSGTSNTIFFQTYDGASLAERFRVTHTGATVTGTLNIDNGISIADNIITTSATNANLELSAAGTGEVTTDTNFKLMSATPFIKIQRTDNANVPGIDFLGQAGTSGSKILFDGTGGTANELIFQTFTGGGGLAEAFRVTGTGAKVTGNLEVTGSQIDFSALPTSDPGVAGRLYRDGATVKVSL